MPLPNQIGFMDGLLRLDLSEGRWRGPLPDSFYRPSVFPNLMIMDTSNSLELSGEQLLGPWGAEKAGPAVSSQPVAH